MGTAGRKKNQFMVLVDDVELHRLDALRVVMGVSRAEVCRRVIKGQTLGELEAVSVQRLRRLDEQATRAGLTPVAFVRALVLDRVTLPSLEELEGMAHADLMAELHIPFTPSLRPAEAPPGGAAA